MVKEVPFQRALEKIAKRKKMTRRGRELVVHLLRALNQRLGAEDKLDGYATHKTFNVKIYKYFKAGWEVYETEGRLAYRNGEVVIIDRAGDPEITVETDPDDILYINYSDFTETVKEFIENIANMKTFEDEIKKIEEIIKILEK